MFHQRSSAGVVMLVLDPDKRSPAKSRFEKSIIRAHRGEAVDPGSPEHANGNSEREPCAVNAAAQTGMDGHVKKLQSQSARKNVPQPRGPGELRQPPGRVRLRTPEPGEYAVDKQNVRERSDDIANQTLSVAPEPIDLPSGVTPAVTLPGLQSVTHDPPRTLPHGSAQLAWKVLALGQQAVAGL